MDMAMGTAVANKRRGLVSLSISFVVLGATTLASAQQTIEASGATERRSDISVTFSGGRTDNVLQAGTNEISATYTAPGVVMDIARERRRMRYTVTSDLEFREYSSSLVDDELWGTLNAELELRAIPDRLSWLFQDNFGQGRQNAFLASGPGNRERINVITTGPALFIPFAGINELRASLLTGQRTFDSSGQFDGDTLHSEAGVFRRLSPTTEVGFSVSQREVEYDNPVFDNEIDNIFITYTKELASGSASLRVGTSEVDMGALSDDAALVDLSWVRNLGARSALQLDLANGFVDAGDEFRGGDATQDQFLNVDVYERTGAGAAFTIRGNRSLLRLGARIGEDRYQNQLILDNESFSLQVNYERQVSPRMRLALAANSREVDFSSLNRTDKDYIYSVSVARDFGQRMNLNIQLEHDTRSSNFFGEFDENTIIFALQFNLNQTQSASGI